ncbi:MAG: hypothetical protein HY033_12865 [Ignavibacteriae bacterium]|nr:hypothetical protein [Ignavibacteria bacterium]MBI3365785.1 hypothetical protein [Ignavibacteriota bacterium]
MSQLKARHILGMHNGTFPALAGTPTAVRKHLPGALMRRMVELEPGKRALLK